MTPDEIEKLIRIVTEPEEDWSAADAEYVLRLYGIDPADSSKEACDLILRMIESARDKHEEVPPEYMNILWDLTSEDDKESEVIANARRAIQEMQEMPFPPELAAAAVTQHFREKRDLSDADKEILKDLERKLFEEASKSLDLTAARPIEASRLEMKGKIESPEHYARALLKHVDGRQPVRLADVAKKIGLRIEYEDSTGFDGALLRVVGVALGIVAVRKTMEKSRRRFTAAHEMGHYIIPGHDAAVCKSSDDEVVGDDGDRLEQAANKFARELLMPSSVVSAIVKRFGVSMETCRFVRNQFDVSLTAAATRLIEVTKRRAALVVTKNGVRWRFQPSERFEGHIYRGVPLSPDSLASQLSSRSREKKGLVPLKAWIKTTSEDLVIHEDSLLMPKYEIILTLLTPAR